MNYFVPRITFRVQRGRAFKSKQYRREITSPRVAAKLLFHLIPDDGREHFGMFMLDHLSRVLGYHEIAVGTRDVVPARSREVFGAALNMPDTSAIVLVHNHAVGSPMPSKDDRRLTRHLVKVGTALDVTVIDHLILSMSTGRVFSFAREQSKKHAQARRHAILGKESDNGHRPTKTTRRSSTKGSRHVVAQGQVQTRRK